MNRNHNVVRKTIYDRIRAHATIAHSPHRDVLSLLYEFFDIFNERFFAGKLEPVVIVIEPFSVRSCHGYSDRTDSMGISRKIRLNSKYVGTSRVKALRLLLHVMIHLDQLQDNTAPTGRRNYHNRAFCQRAQELGVPCELDSGRDLGAPSAPFTSILEEAGFNVEKEVAISRSVQPRKKGSNLRKWTCGCTIVRVGVREFEAKCLKCNQTYKMAE